MLPSGIDSFAPSVRNLPFRPLIRTCPDTTPATTLLPSTGTGPGGVITGGGVGVGSVGVGSAGAITVKLRVALVPALPAASVWCAWAV